MPDRYFQIHLREIGPGDWSFSFYRCENGGIVDRVETRAGSLSDGLEQAEDFIRPGDSVAQRVAELRRAEMMGGSPL